MGGYSPSYDEVFSILEESNEGLDSISSILSSISEIAGMGFVGVLIIVAIVSAIVSFVVSIILWILGAIPVYKLATKMNRKNAWLAWVPIFGSQFRLWVLSDIAGDKPFTVFNGKITVKSRSNSFWIYLAINYLGGAVVTAVVGVFSTIIPIMGSLSAVLMLVPTVACAIMEYVYLRDVLDIFKEDKKSNQTTAIVVTALDSLVTFGFARIIYLYTLLKYQPLPQVVVSEQAEVK